MKSAQGAANAHSKFYTVVQVVCTLVDIQEWRNNTTKFWRVNVC